MTAQPRPTPGSSTIEVVGHGGAGDFFPGNSRPAIEKALEIGVDRIEFDVQVSAGGDLVLVHDDEVRIGSGRPRPVNELSTAELRAALPGLLTVEEAVELIAYRVPLMIDIKNPGYERKIIDAIQRHGLAGCSSVSTTNLLVLHRLRTAFPTMRLGLSTGHWSSGAPTPLGRAIATKLLRVLTPVPLIAAAEALRATEVMVFHRVCTRRLVDALHTRGLKINVWTIDNPAIIRHAITFGVDGIISNRPDLVWEELVNAGLRQPPAR